MRYIIIAGCVSQLEDVVQHVGGIRQECQQQQGGKGGGAAPPAPDYRGAAQEQAASSREVTDVQNWANRPNLQTPWGATTWDAEKGQDPGTGKDVTKWSGSVTLSPDQQAALDSQMRIQAGRSGGAETLLDQATGNFQKEFNWDGMPAAPGNIEDAQKSNYELMSKMFEPGRTQQRAALDTRLANMGVSSDSEAYRRQQANLGEQFGRQDIQTAIEAQNQGRTQAAAQMQLRQQAIAEEAQRRGMTLNELNALLTGQQVSMPQMPSFAAASRAEPVQALNAAQMQGNYGLQAANLNQSTGADYGSMAGAGIGLASAAMMMCDRRLKKNIKSFGNGFYEYEYVWGGPRMVGCMAQDVQRVRPDAVIRHASGYLMVNYARL